MIKMIRLTKFGGDSVDVNAQFISSIEQSRSDVNVRMSNGSNFIVSDTMEQIRKMIENPGASS